MDVVSAGHPPGISSAMNGDLVDLTTLSPSELEQIIGPSAMEGLDGMHMAPSPNGMFSGIPYESAGATSHMMNGGSSVHQNMPVSHPPMMQQVNGSVAQESEPRRAGGQSGSEVEAWVEIVEQPKQRGLRFRYQCEGRSAGSIPGENSTNENKTFPTIKLHNYRGQAIVVVSCVTKEAPPRCRPHPHSLVGKDCKKGVCTVKVKDANVISFPQLGIQCAKKKDVEDALKLRKEINVDPYQTGFEHVSSNIDLNVVRLCFQVFLPDPNGKVTRVVPPVVSEPIQDKKAQNDLIICRVDKTSGKARGGDEVFLLCEKVGKDDIKVRFYEEGENEEILWHAFGDFGQGDVHRQYAIVFKTPRYKEEYISRPVHVNMQLFRPSNQQGSDPIKFTYMPEDPDPDRIEEKRKRKGDWLNKMMPSSGSSDGGPSSSSSSVKESLRHMLTANRRIKQENKAGCTQAGGARGMSMSSQGSVSSLEPLSNTSSAPQPPLPPPASAAPHGFRTSTADSAHTTPNAATATTITATPSASSSSSQPRPPSATVTSLEQAQLVQQFVAHQQAMVASGTATMSFTSTASNGSQPVSLDESLLNLVTQPTSTLLSNFDMNVFTSMIEQGHFSSEDAGSLNMAEGAVASSSHELLHNHHAQIQQQQQQPMQAEDYAQQQADFLEVQAALESLNQS